MKSVLYDETVFEEPDKFKPERFLEGDVRLKKERMVFFGLGKTLKLCTTTSLSCVLNYCAVDQQQPFPVNFV